MKSGFLQNFNMRFFAKMIAVACIIEGTILKSAWKQLSVTTTISPYYCNNLMIDALSSEAVIAFVPIISVLHYSGTYIDDLKSKFVIFHLIRSNYHSYLISCIMVCFLCGGGVILLGNLLSWGVSALLFVPMEMVTEKDIASTTSILPIFVLFFLSGGLWAVVGMALSTIMESKYIAYASPFVIYYLLVILCERYLPDAYLLYPPNWTNPDVWPYGAWGASIFLLELTLAFSILFAIRARRRLREL